MHNDISDARVFQVVKLIDMLRLTSRLALRNGMYDRLVEYVNCTLEGSTNGTKHERNTLSRYILHFLTVKALFLGFGWKKL